MDYKYKAFETPGMVDLQVNGYAGLDFNAGDFTAQQLESALIKMLMDGVSFCLPTIITDTFETMRYRLKVLDDAIQGSELAKKMVLGIHLEGPFISAQDGYRGCHPLSGIQEPTIENYQGLIEGLKTPVAMVTLAPETDRDLVLSKYLTSLGVCVSIGHSAVDRHALVNATKSGVTCATHLNNGLTPTLDKNENPLFSILSNDAIHAGIIADSIHILPHIMTIIWRTKGIDKLFLVTDGTAGSSAQPGNYTLGSVDIRLDVDGQVKMLEEDRLAGSGVTMRQMMSHMVNWFELSPSQLVQVGRENALTMLDKRFVDGAALSKIDWAWIDGEFIVTAAEIDGQEYKPS
ncbi:hypothetical protein [Photobacterium satsumensis]|uniref:hypothetical protein n=1 Tax=Photobacterium satsumensis TaxID=2910239 RepID=UPI003D0EFAD2